MSLMKIYKIFNKLLLKKTHLINYHLKGEKLLI